MKTYRIFILKFFCCHFFYFFHVCVLILIIKLLFSFFTLVIELEVGPWKSESSKAGSFSFLRTVTT